MGLKRADKGGGGDLEIATSGMAGRSQTTPPSCTCSDEGETTTPALHLGIEHSQSRSGDGLTFAEEEEESSKDGDIQSDPSHMQPQSSNNDRVSFAGGIGEVGVGAMSRKRKKPHRSTEEEEESSDEDSELIAAMQYRVANDEASTDGDDNPHPGIGFTEASGAETKNESTDGEEWQGHAPAPSSSLSQTPLIFSGHSSPDKADVGFESGSRQASSALGTTEKVLDLWND
ncbi:hypothetical protein EI94DRAFT_1813492 [Lactarius quietus]|nr:hypothetical protein EI94DRAFT_1813492 [Lactarius quietus]